MPAGVYISSTNIFSPVGENTAETFSALYAGESGVRSMVHKKIWPDPFYASMFKKYPEVPGYSPFESILISSIEDALKYSRVNANDEKTILILSTTKGNISLIESDANIDPAEISLSRSAKKIQSHFGFVHTPLLVSNACISGILAMIVAKRLIEAGIYQHAVVAGADIISSFILSGFQSFQAISPGLCKPFDAGRNGINLGEAAATIVLTRNPEYSNGIRLAGGAVSNDANHISGPSRTGEELGNAILNATSESGITVKDIDFISAHGTATVYNDEMEANAFHIAGVQHAPLNSLKGFFGHTLGAAGLIESAISIHSLLKGIILPTPGFEQPGTTQKVNVLKELKHQDVCVCLKTGSGFGGCNAAVIFQKMITN